MRIGIWIAVTGVAIGGGLGFLMWHSAQVDEDRQHERIAEVRKLVASGPFVFDGDVDLLVAEFRDNELAAKDRYYGKALKVRGRVRSVTRNRDGQVVILLDGDLANHEVVCAYDGVEEGARALSAGESRIVHGLGMGVDLNGPLLGGCAIEPR